MDQLNKTYIVVEQSNITNESGIYSKI